VSKEVFGMPKAMLMFPLVFPDDSVAERTTRKMVAKHGVLATGSRAIEQIAADEYRFAGRKPL
jgi:hypothetical protein